MLHLHPAPQRPRQRHRRHTPRPVTRLHAFGSSRSWRYPSRIQPRRKRHLRSQRSPARPRHRRPCPPHQTRHPCFAPNCGWQPSRTRRLHPAHRRRHLPSRPSRRQRRNRRRQTPGRLVTRRRTLRPKRRRPRLLRRLILQSSRPRRRGNWQHRQAAAASPLPGRLAPARRQRRCRRTDRCSRWRCWC